MKLFLQLVLPAVFAAWAAPLIAQDYNITLRSTLDFPGQTLANVCGYAQNGKEYALLGASKGMVIVDVTNPDQPVQIVQIPGPNDLWKEIKTYSHYAYVTTEGGGGVQIVDLKDLPSPNLQYHNYNGTGDVADNLKKIHALHIDVKKGFLYTYGGTQVTALAHDLNADPYNPVYVGRFDQLDYVHDGYVENDTLYACHISPAGVLSIVDMTDKNKPVLLGSVDTPSKYTHNSWLLADHKHILTTDERTPSFLTCYDISDPSDIRELDRFSTDNGYGSIGHNTHVLNDWAITSWYSEGVVIVDAHRPENLVQVGKYDTWPESGPTFDGCWGVYPFLPSGNLIATNIPQTGGNQTGKMFVLSPVYNRACYLEGRVFDGCTGNPLIGAQVKIESADPVTNTLSKNDGSYQTGQVTPGTFTVTVSKSGYMTGSITATLKSGEVTPLDITLEPLAAYNVTTTVLNSSGGAAIGNTSLFLTNGVQNYSVQTDAAGKFDLDCAIGGSYRVGAWGYYVADYTISQNGTGTLVLQPGWYDDFELDLGWSTSATASSGFWAREKPIGTTLNNALCNPGDDANSDNNQICYTTGNAGGQPGADDIDNGMVTLVCPTMQLAQYSDAVLNFAFWFYNGGGTGSTPNDYFEVQVTNGVQTATVFTQKESGSTWRSSGDIHLKDFLPLTDQMKVYFIAADENPGHVVEAAVDVFLVTPGLVKTVEPDPSAQVNLSPNPSASAFQLNYDWPDAQHIVLEVRNTLGQLLVSRELSSNHASTHFGTELPKGLYLVNLRSESRQSAVIRAVKQ